MGRESAENLIVSKLDAASPNAFNIARPDPSAQGTRQKFTCWKQVETAPTFTKRDDRESFLQAIKNERRHETARAGVRFLLCFKYRTALQQSKPA
jgi:hypothetical protein